MATTKKPGSGRARPSTKRASGAEQKDEVTRAESGALDKPLDDGVGDQPHLPEDDTPGKPKFRTPGFSRMKIAWAGDDAMTMASIKRTIDERIFKDFKDAYVIMNELFELVREPRLDEDGQPMTDDAGYVIWKRRGGRYVEDWSKLTYPEKNKFMFAITSRLFAWEEVAADAWSESMFARAIWEEHFSLRYQDPPDGTIEDRTSFAKGEVAQDRYFAVFCAAYSRRADAVVRSMQSLSQRIKDSMTSQ